MKMWIKNNWELLFGILNILLTVIIAFLTVVIALYANKLTKYNNKLYEKELYPHFRVIETLKNKNEDGFYCDTVIHIKNYGGNYYKLDSTVRTYISFNINGDKYFMPLIGYYFVSSNTFENDIVRTHFYPNNNLKVVNHIFSVNKKLRAENILGDYGSIITFVKIQYQDVFGNENVQYLRASDSELLDKTFGEKYVDLFDGSTEYNGKHYSFDIDEITEELLYEFATTDLKKPYLFEY